MIGQPDILFYLLTYIGRYPFIFLASRSKKNVVDNVYRTFSVLFYFERFSSKSAIISSVSSRSSSERPSFTSVSISVRSFSSTSDILLKLITKFNGLRISCIIPAVSIPKEASFPVAATDSVNSLFVFSTLPYPYKIFN